MLSAISAIATVTCSGDAVAPTGRIWLLFFTALLLVSWRTTRSRSRTQQCDTAHAVRDGLWRRAVCGEQLRRFRAATREPTMKPRLIWTTSRGCSCIAVASGDGGAG